jgi:hypothetical protein
MPQDVERQAILAKSTFRKPHTPWPRKFLPARNAIILHFLPPNPSRNIIFLKQRPVRYAGCGEASRCCQDDPQEAGTCPGQEGHRVFGCPSKRQRGPGRHEGGLVRRPTKDGLSGGEVKHFLYVLDWSVGFGSWFLYKMGMLVLQRATLSTFDTLWLFER